MLDPLAEAVSHSHRIWAIGPEHGTYRKDIPQESNELKLRFLDPVSQNLNTLSRASIHSTPGPGRGPFHPNSSPSQITSH